MQDFEPHERPIQPPADPPVPPANTPDRYQAAIDYIYRRIDYERTSLRRRHLADFKLQRPDELLRRLGAPNQQIPAVHIAGTKGKGSTAAMVAAMLTGCGYRVGLFTSPHMVRFEERMTVDGQMPSAQQLCALTDRVREVADVLQAEDPAMAPTFFEITTALAWLHFVEQEVDIVVLETGLGGRLDTTTLCRPLVTLITSISYDHTALLGRTLAAIAREKAGIAKAGVPMLSGVLDAEPARPIAAACERVGAPLYRLDHDLRLTTHRATDDHVDAPDLPRYTVDVETPWRRHAGVPVPLPGIHQATNAALALAAMDILNENGFPSSVASLASGLAASRCPLRLEVMERKPLVIVDSAHNGASIDALCRTLADIPITRRIGVFGTSRDKDAAAMLERLDGTFDELILTQYLSNPRALPVGELSAIAGSLSTPWKTADSPQTALELARASAGGNDLICVTGSFFLASETRELLLPIEERMTPTGTST